MREHQLLPERALEGVEPGSCLCQFGYIVRLSRRERLPRCDRALCTWFTATSNLLRFLQIALPSYGDLQC